MKNNRYNYIFGPIPSRRLGMSLGVSPIPKKFCNYSCIYCQIGRTNNITNTRQKFFPLNKIIDEFKNYINENIDFDVITLVGEGEPTLYSKLGELIIELKKIINKPIAVITNGALMNSKDVQNDLMKCDIVLPSMDAFDDNSFKKLHRPHGKIKFLDSYNGLVEFSKRYTGELWIEVMLIDGINTSKNALLKIKSLISNINHSNVYINTAVRPPAESWVNAASKDALDNAVDILNGISIDKLCDGDFISETVDNFDAILSIIKRHPMNEHELKSFLNSRHCTKEETKLIFNKLDNNTSIIHIDYNGLCIYRLK